jgi:hypothetical protein
MAFGTERFAGGGDQNEIELDHLLLRRGQWSSSSPEEKWVSPRFSESSMKSASAIFFFFADARDGDGAAEVDSSGTSVKSRPGYSPSSS